MLNIELQPPPPPPPSPSSSSSSSPSSSNYSTSSSSSPSCYSSSSPPSSSPLLLLLLFLHILLLFKLLLLLHILLLFKLLLLPLLLLFLLLPHPSSPSTFPSFSYSPSSSCYYPSTSTLPIGFGYADVENGVRCSPDTVMRIASIGKTLVMAIAGKLLQTGDLDLDRDVREYVKTWPQKTYDNKNVWS